MADGADELLLKITYQNRLQAKKIKFTNKTLVAEACLIISTKFGEGVPGRGNSELYFSEQWVLASNCYL